MDRPPGVDFAPATGRRSRNMKRQNERTAVVDHEEAMERAVAELLLDARREVMHQDLADLERQMHGAQAEAPLPARRG